MANAKKPRILYLLKILWEDTDEVCGLSLPEIQDKLQDYGVDCERKSLYRDFAALEDFGIVIGKIRSRPVRYYLESRLFGLSQIMLLVDAVQSTRSLTKANTHMLIQKLKKLVSIREANNLDARVHVLNRVKTQNESVFNELDIIQRAITEKRDIAFTYVHYDVEKQLHEAEAHDGKPREKTPLFLVYNGENYYMLAYDEKAVDHVRNYRVDRMRNIILMEASDASHKVSPNFDIAKYERETLGMYGGEPVTIVLQVAEGLVDSIVDMFGADGIDSYEAEGVKELPGSKEIRRWANIHVKVTPSPVFFGQIAQFGGDVRIVGPSKVARAYEEQLSRAIKSQEL